MNETSSKTPADAAPSHRLSYKFQRLRERLREAIASGDLQGKLPGERQLARKLRVNAKTLSKALTDLAAEGLLDRSIGRGTFVRGSAGEQPAPTSERWIILCDESQRSNPVIQKLIALNPHCEQVSAFSDLRPSFLNQFKAAINFSDSTPETTLRDLMIRNISVLQVGREPSTYSTHAVVIDRIIGISLLARDMLLQGHRHFAVVEPRGQVQLAQTVRAAARHARMEATVDAVEPGQVAAAVEQGATGVICSHVALANQSREALERQGIHFPGRVAMGAVGASEANHPCSGYFVDPAQMAETIVQLIRERLGHRPMVLWLTGGFVDAGTLSLSVHPAAMEQQPQTTTQAAQLHS